VFHISIWGGLKLRLGVLAHQSPPWRRHWWLLAKDLPQSKRNWKTRSTLL